ncbi:hypothetical protein EDB81DRAFT_436366 [Dactylonectria macrodidyma]|uniref:Uncharacterized protein n=1 Tax=Dactylonectria macrodidyma TaxID=307937 RepID=A0A9P9J805_9HYPO|nr:hypothetical protein EDB81DRAFT_436366 [Dactylonectria macrodidyma]
MTGSALGCPPASLVVLGGSQWTPMVLSGRVQSSVALGWSATDGSGSRSGGVAPWAGAGRRPGRLDSGMGPLRRGLIRRTGLAEGGLFGSQGAKGAKVSGRVEQRGQWRVEGPRRLVRVCDGVKGAGVVGVLVLTVADAVQVPEYLRLATPECGCLRHSVMEISLKYFVPCTSLRPRKMRGASSSSSSSVFKSRR